MFLKNLVAYKSFFNAPDADFYNFKTILRKKTASIVLIFAALLAILIYACKSNYITLKPQKSISNKITINPEPIEDSVIKIKINIVGDLMCHKPQMTNAKLSDSIKYDFNPSFEFIKPYLEDADITIGNLETTFAGEKYPYAGYPAFNTPDPFALALKNTGFDLLVTANNHSMDTQESGLLRTIKILKKNNIEYTGTFESQSDHDYIRIIDLKGIKLAILNYTYGTNGILPSKKHSYLLNIIDSAKICSQINQAKQLGADEVLVFYHFGQENISEPTKSQIKAVKIARMCGSKIIIGAHPHVISPVEFIKPDSIVKDSVFVAYSLGNFISNQYWRYTDAGVILSLFLEKNKKSNKTSLKNIEFMPTWVYRGSNPKKKQHIIIPAEWYKTDSLLPSFIDENAKTKITEAFDDTQKMITKNKTKINLKSVF